ncbi:O-antigen ligase family protein [Chamaesiphon sp. OTE_75_metabat_556]|uniref:O-antigen ligase family protein n=1 Tax=Chamaesiphon sp. OTE_75_metabat_556 TaxID=2964692 RepID=UPI00286BC5DF|nr:O-antigen ligase family protein [Chamaesiphon sp. OTE_75_metabat_556]
MSSKLIEQFAEPRNKTKIFLDRYQYVLSIITAFLFFSDFPDWLLAAPIVPINPLSWIIAFAVLALPFYKKLATIPKPLIAWMLFYVGIALLSLMTVSADEISFTDFRSKVLAALFIALMYIIFQQRSVNQVKCTALFVLFMNVCNNMLELFSPKMFSELNVGRPAGFYIDPNKAGCALMLTMLLSITIVKKPYRWIILLVAGVGIMATFSRGAILGWVICTLLLIIGRVVCDQRRKVLAPIVIFIILLASLNPLQALTDYFKGDPTGANWDIVNRLEEFQNPSLKEDSAMERQAVAAGGWLMFGNRPFWGNGLASTRKWMVSEVSTHNMYLYYMADHGILGVLFLPGAIFAVVYRNRGEEQTILICFGVFVSLWGLFSHEVLAERFTLSSFALLAAMNTNQKWYLKYTNRNFNTAPSPSIAPAFLPPVRNQRIVSQKRD